MSWISIPHTMCTLYNALFWDLFAFEYYTAGNIIKSFNKHTYSIRTIS